MITDTRKARKQNSFGSQSPGRHKIFSSGFKTHCVLSMCLMATLLGLPHRPLNHLRRQWNWTINGRQCLPFIVHHHHHHLHHHWWEQREQRRKRITERQSFCLNPRAVHLRDFSLKVHVVHGWSAALEIADAIPPLSCPQSTQLRCKYPALCTWTLIHGDRFQVSEDVTGSERQNNVVLRRRPISHRPRLM